MLSLAPMAFLTSASVEAGCIFVTKSANRKASCVGAVLQLGIYSRSGAYTVGIAPLGGSLQLYWQRIQAKE